MMLPPRRHDVLDLLADQMGRGMGSQSYQVNPEMWQEEVMRRRQAWQPPLPPGLPDAVQKSIREMPAYSEREVIPRPPEQQAFNYRDFEPDLALQMTDRNQRERLPYELGMAEQFPSYGIPLPEGLTARPTDTGSPYRRPYNLGLGNLGALY